MGDTADGLSQLKITIQNAFPELFVHTIRIGSSNEEDRRAGFFDSIERQVAEVCSALNDIYELKDGFNAVGFSQGGLFFRSYLQTCNGPKIHNLMTFGAPHGGVSDIPNCLEDSYYCRTMRSIVKNGVYWSWVQAKIVQAQYFKKVDDYENYLKSNTFLPDSLQELAINTDYKQRMEALDSLILVRFLRDEMISPRDTAWFSYFNRDGVMEPMSKQPYYESLGLKKLDSKDKIKFVSLEGEHMTFNSTTFTSLLDQYFYNSNLSVQ